MILLLLQANLHPNSASCVWFINVYTLDRSAVGLELP